MYLYKRTDDSIKILSVLGYDGVVQLPETIDGSPVTELAAYAFSEGRGADAMLSAESAGACLADADGKEIGSAREWESLKTDGMERICGLGLKEIYLPKSLCKIGNYAFYLCYELEKIHCSSRIRDLGAGLFTGCTGVQSIAIQVEEGEKSCLKEILSELRQELDVDYESGRGKAKLVFPELYEESVENTPARIINATMHGCGHRYRYCFDKTDFQFQRYDALFPHVKVQEPERLVARLVMGRLRCPLGLMQQYREAYEEYLREHLDGAARECLGKKDTEQLEWLAEHYGESRETLETMAGLARDCGDLEAVSFLMDLMHRKYPARRRRFSL